MMFSITLIVVLLIIWFRTDAYIEYCRIFKLNFISCYKDYDLKKYNDVSIEYHAYLRQYHNCFFVRLITCPICLTTWMGIIVGSLMCNVWCIPLVILCSLTIYLLIDKLLE